MLGRTNVMNPKVELEEITVNPGTSDVVKTADDGKGFSKVTVPGDADLITKNIREGVDIFGILGTLKEGTMTAVTGNFTLTSDKQNNKIANPFGAKEKVAAVFCACEYVSTTCANMVFKDFANNFGFTLYARNLKNQSLITVTDANITIEGYASGTYPLQSNQKYYYSVIGME